MCALVGVRRKEEIMTLYEVLVDYLQEHTIKELMEEVMKAIEKTGRKN